MTDILPIADKISQENALEILKNGGLAAIPTETVYGLAADATNGAAVARIYEVKGRPEFNPLIIHCADFAMAEQYGVFRDLSKRCAEIFWPGPLTLVVPYREDAGLSSLVRAGLPTIAIRVPKGHVRDIIADLGVPLAAPSANLSGRVSPTTSDHVKDQLGGRIDLILEDGPCTFGLESTIVHCENDSVTVLRPGGIGADEIEKTLGCDVVRADDKAKIAAPGMLKSHYAPMGVLRLNALEIGGEDGVINFGNSALEAPHTINLSEAGDLREAAANLFAALSYFDTHQVKRIAVAPIPQTGLGEAINDRLRRAAAPR